MSIWRGVGIICESQKPGHGFKANKAYALPRLLLSLDAGGQPCQPKEVVYARFVRQKARPALSFLQ